MKHLDEIIQPAVEILNSHGFETFESCQGGEGHCYHEPTIRFFGNEFDLIRAFEICQCYGLAVSEVKRVFRKVDVYKDDNTSKTLSIGFAWDKPFNEIIFTKSETGSIFFRR